MLLGDYGLDPAMVEAEILPTREAEPDVRAFVRIAGILAGLPTNRAKKRVLTFVEDTLNDPGFAYRDHYDPAVSGQRSYR